MHWRSVWLTASSAVAALGLAACGGDGAETRETAPGPRIERTVAASLAARSDEVARRLETGDPCGAAEEAARLRGDLTTAINERQIPEAYLEDLSGLVNEIEAQIPPCATPAPPPAESGGDEEKRKGREKDKREDEERGGGGEGDDD